MDVSKWGPWAPVHARWCAAGATWNQGCGGEAEAEPEAEAEAEAEAEPEAEPEPDL